MLDQPIRIPLKKVTSRTEKFVDTCKNLIEEHEFFILSSTDPHFKNQFHIVVGTLIYSCFIRVDLENADEPNLISKANMAILNSLVNNKPITFKLEGKFFVITTL